MRRALAALLGAGAVVACVPASEPQPPAGAAGFAVDPSPGARGVPFESDGWTVTVEKVVFRTHVTATPERRGLGPDDIARGGSEELVVDGSRRAEIFASGISTGPVRLHAYMYGRYLGDAEAGEPDDVLVVNATPADVARFARPADHGPSSGEDLYGPTVLFAAAGRRGATTVKLDVAISTTQVGTTTPDVLVEVRADQLALAPLAVVPELVFGGDVRFGAIAAADADRDGEVTAAELRAAPDPGARAGGPSAIDRGSLLEALAARIGDRLLQPRALP